MNISLAQKWREVDMIQRKINNLRREMDEKTTQLKAIFGILAALVAGFDIVVLVELSFPDDITGTSCFHGRNHSADCLPHSALAFVTSTLMMVGILKSV